MKGEVWYSSLQCLSDISCLYRNIWQQCPFTKGLYALPLSTVMKFFPLSVKGEMNWLSTKQQLMHICPVDLMNHLTVKQMSPLKDGADQSILSSSKRKRWGKLLLDHCLSVIQVKWVYNTAKVHKYEKNIEQENKKSLKNRKY